MESSNTVMRLCAVFPKELIIQRNCNINRLFVSDHNKLCLATEEGVKLIRDKLNIINIKAATLKEC